MTQNRMFCNHERQSQSNTNKFEIFGSECDKYKKFKLVSTVCQTTKHNY